MRTQVASDTQMGTARKPLAALTGGTAIVGFVRYSRDRIFAVLGQHGAFLVAMAAGSIIGTLLGALLLSAISATLLYPLLAVILVFSAFKVWRHA